MQDYDNRGWMDQKFRSMLKTMVKKLCSLAGNKVITTDRVSK